MPKKYVGDSTLLGTGNIEMRMESLLKRRKMTALTGQHRETQRFDKEIQLLRAALGLDPMDPLNESIVTQRSAKDPTNGENIVIANDVGWIKKVTICNLASMQKILREKGYNYKIEKAASITSHVWQGFYKNKPDNLIVNTIGRDWAIAATRNGENLNVFCFNPIAENANEKGIPSEIATTNWDGNLSPATKQNYAESWSQLLKSI